MTTKHSKQYEKKKQALDEAEMRMRDDINDASEKTEKSAIKIAKIVGVTALAVGIGYLVYRQFSGKEKDDETQKQAKAEKVKESKGSGAGTWFTGILVTGLSYFIGGLLKSKKTKD